MVKSVLFGLSLAAASAAPAHAPLPNVQWCERGEIVEIATFAFPPHMVMAYAQCLRTGACPDPVDTPDSTCTLKTCGDFDDDYGAGTRMAHVQCGQAAAAEGLTPAQQLMVVPVVSAPLEYLSAHHHARYRASMGLAGSCALCQADAAPPPIWTPPRDP